MGQKVIDCEITGIAGLIQNNIEGSEKQMLTKGKRATGGVKNDEDEWKLKIYKYNGGLGHPGAAVESALVKAARDFKADKRRSMTDIIKALVFVNEPFIELVGKKQPDHVRRDSVVNPHTKGRGFVYRPLFDAGWKGKFSLTLFDDEIVELARVKEILDYAGYRIGIGDWRPKFGRFIISRWAIRK
jgi:hypothetical protein